MSKKAIITLAATFVVLVCCVVYFLPRPLSLELSENSIENARVNAILFLFDPSSVSNFDTKNIELEGDKKEAFLDYLSTLEVRRMLPRLGNRAVPGGDLLASVIVITDQSSLIIELGNAGYISVNNQMDYQFVDKDEATMNLLKLLNYRTYSQAFLDSATG